MPVSFPPQSAAQLALVTSAPHTSFAATQASHLAAGMLALPAGATNDVQPNQQFGDLWLRFVSSVAQMHPAAQDNGGIRKYDGPALNGAGQDVSIEELHVDSSGVTVGGEPPKP